MIITLLTDFGLKDNYVGMMKGVIYSIYSDAKIVDITHEVAPQNMTSAAFTLYGAYRYFPPGTVHIAVVDPGVGTSRKAIALQVPEIGYFVGPDNGIFHHILANYKNAVPREITNPAFMLQPVSKTFHGRDIFAPTAAQLAKGEPFGNVGSLLDRSTLTMCENIINKPSETFIHPAVGLGLPYFEGKIIHIDQFGNLITNILETFLRDKYTSEQLPNLRIELNSSGIPIRIKGIKQTYGDANEGELIALIGSSGFLEIARVNGRADKIGVGNIRIGQAIKIYLMSKS